MTLSPGVQLGGYEVLAKLGEGGMGEVYRARDMRLKREVALKILPESFAADEERLARFQREAEVLASLNHPNIAAIYGVEEAGHIRALVLELVEGETLADRASTGVILLGETLSIAIQIAEALEAAHERGIVHRDLKPANIKVRPDGTVKVLDFGLAKLVDPGSSRTGATGVALSLSPTITSPVGTMAGVILGTAPYMSPEQARGFQADHRSDLFSFGCVLYEMLTGTRAFQGDSVPDTLASVLAREPDLTALPPNLNPRLHKLLRRCLAKDPRQRWQAAGDLRFELDEIARAPHGDAAAKVAPASSWRYVALYGAPALVIGAASALLGTWLTTRPPAERIIRTTIATTAATIVGPDRVVAITPDGTSVVYVGSNGTKLFVRPLGALETVAIASGSGLRGPFVSPNGEWVGFFDDEQRMLRVPITGGPAIPIVERIDGGTARGASWGPDDTIVFGTSNTATGLQRVSAAGGPVTVLTRPDRTQGEGDHEWPQLLPGGAVLFTTRPQDNTAERSVAVLDVRTMTQKILVPGGSDAKYLRNGYIVYAASGTLRAIGFDLERLDVRGAPVPVLPRLAVSNLGYGSFALSDDGTLVYVDGPSDGTSAARRTLAWIDRSGKQQDIPVPPRQYLSPRISPDGAFIAVDAFDDRGDIFIWDIRRATMRRLTMNPNRDGFAVWTPDSRWVVYTAASDVGNLNLWRVPADGSASPERLLMSTNIQIPTAITPDGHDIIFHEVMPLTSADVMRVPLSGPHTPEVIVQTKDPERQAAVSRDGRWLAYEAGSGPRSEVFVRPYATGPQPRFQISTDGGSKPAWGPNELFYLAPDNSLMRAPMPSGTVTWNAENPTKLLGPLPELPGTPEFTRAYDVSSDGQRFVFVKSSGELPASNTAGIVVVQHWDREVAARVPGK